MRFKILKKILRIIAIILPCFLFTFVFSSPSFAVSECSITLYPSPYNWTEFPTNCSLPLSSYHYIKGSGGSSSVSFRVGPSTSDIRFNFLSFYLDFDIRQITLEDNFKFYSYGNQSIPSGSTVVLLDSLGTVPSGNFSITANGDYDISQYASVSVAVPPEVIQGDYHDDLVSINNTIVLIPAVALVIYFFFAIYRLLIGGF